MLNYSLNIWVNFQSHLKLAVYFKETKGSNIKLGTCQCFSNDLYYVDILDPWETFSVVLSFKPASKLRKYTATRRFPGCNHIYKYFLLLPVFNQTDCNITSCLIVCSHCKLVPAKYKPGKLHSFCVVALSFRIRVGCYKLSLKHLKINK